MPRRAMSRGGAGMPAGSRKSATVKRASSWIEAMGTALRALGRRVDEALLLFAFRFTLVGFVIGDLCLFRAFDHDRQA